MHRYIGYATVCPLSSLLPHEKTDDAQVFTIKSLLARAGGLFLPILVDTSTFIIIDGHTRCEALRQLGCTRTMAMMVDYSSKFISVEGWHGEIIRKQQVIRAASTGMLMQSKTTRHLVRMHNTLVHLSAICPPIWIPLEELR